MIASANGDAAHTELAGDVVLVHAVALAQLAVEDQRANVDRDEVTAAGPVDERDRGEPQLVRIR